MKRLELAMVAVFLMSPFAASGEGPVCYEDFGAVGDGKADDSEAIVKAHDHANANNLPVKAKAGATYYIGGKKRTAIIMTNTDFGSAKFIVDDTKVEHRKANVFEVQSRLKPFKVKGLTTLKKGQPTVGMAFPSPCIVTLTNSGVKHYIRYGLNQNKGKSQTDVILVGKDGTVDPNTPILWDFAKITSAEARPVDPEPLVVKGGHFTTIANRAESRYTYYGRGFAVRRSNVTVDGIQHVITGEGKTGAPYGGFMNISKCANVMVKNAKLSGHKTYRTIGSAGKPVSMGTYDIGCNRALNVTFQSCTQLNDINDRSRWGIMASNFCKNLVYDGCTLSRFDAHMGVANATIRNSTIGHTGINLIGSGTFLLENTTVRGWSFINLRSDYGSTWNGDFVIKNCTFAPPNRGSSHINLINGKYTGQHNFGYTCYMPQRILIDGLKIEDKDHGNDYKGPALFSNINPAYKDASYKEKYPYMKTKEVILKNVTTASGKELRISSNTFMFKDVKVTRE